MIRLLPFYKKAGWPSIRPVRPLSIRSLRQVVIRMVIRITSFGCLIRHTLRELIKLNRGFLRTLRGCVEPPLIIGMEVPGDPYGGLNASTKEYLEPNSDPDKPESAVRHVIDSSMSSTMIVHDSERHNDEGKKGYLHGAERDAMATFLLNLSYAYKGRSIDDDLSREARQGFELFSLRELGILTKT